MGTWRGVWYEARCFFPTLRHGARGCEADPTVPGEVFYSDTRVFGAVLYSDTGVFGAVI